MEEGETMCKMSKRKRTKRQTMIHKILHRCSEG